MAGAASDGATTGPGTGGDAIVAVRGAALSLGADPFAVPASEALRHEPDALIVMRGGRIAACGPAARLLPTLPPGTAVTRYANALIVPGFVDAHVHYAQLPVIGAFGRTLLDWLDRYTFVVEQRAADPAFAAATAEAYLDECLRQGITTAAVYGTVHAGSVDALFAAALRRGMRMIAGKVLMDRHAPAALTDTAQSGYDESKALIARWHGRGRLAYAVTPRFAPTSTPAQLAAAGALVAEHPGTYLQTHLAETHEEIAWVRELFPDARDYLDVYARHGLVGRRSVFGHGVHLAEDAWQRLFDAGSAVAHCPTSNNFLGSGLFRMADAKRAPRPVRVALATDVGGGTTLSMFGTMNEAYKVARHTGFPLTSAQALWLATGGAADALDLAGTIGRLEEGCEADLAVLDLAATPLLAYRVPFCESVDEVLAVLMMLGDDRAVRATWVGGRLAHARAAA
jgi:guanine deaminase